MRIPLFFLFVLLPACVLGGEPDCTPVLVSSDGYLDTAGFGPTKCVDDSLGEDGEDYSACCPSGYDTVGKDRDGNVVCLPEDCFEKE